MDYLCIIVGLIPFVLLIIYACRSYNKKREKEECYGAKDSGQLKHISGLPIPSGVFVDVFYSDEKVVIKKDSQEFILKCDKIISVDCISGKNLKQDIASGAIVGNFIIGGVAGAAIGSILAASIYLTISYESEQENKTIILDTYVNSSFASKIAKDFKKKVHEIKSFEL